MASKTASLILLAFIFVATATPLASGFVYKGQNVKGIRFLGRVVCSRSPYPEPYAQGIGGVNVRITCNGHSTRVTQAVTSSKGFFDAAGADLDGITFEQTTLPCFATVELPENESCSVFLPKATLIAAVTLVGTFSQLPSGLFANAATTPFLPAY